MDACKHLAADGILPTRKYHDKRSKHSCSQRPKKWALCLLADLGELLCLLQQRSVGVGFSLDGFGNDWLACQGASKDDPHFLPCFRAGFACSALMLAMVACVTQFAV